MFDLITLNILPILCIVLAIAMKGLLLKEIKNDVIDFQGFRVEKIKSPLIFNIVLAFEVLICIVLVATAVYLFELP